MDSLENPCNVSAGPVWGAANVVILDPSDPSFNVFNAFTYPAPWPVCMFARVCVFTRLTCAFLFAKCRISISRFLDAFDTS